MLNDLPRRCFRQQLSSGIIASASPRSELYFWEPLIEEAVKHHMERFLQVLLRLF